MLLNTTDRGSRNRAVALLAADQHGVVSRHQLIQLGFHPSSITVRVRAQMLHPVHRGVFAVGHPHLSRHGRMMAGLLTAGDGAAIGRRTALELHGIWRPTDREVDVIVPWRHRGHAGIRMHRVRPMHPDDTTVIDNIVVTTVHRTCVDLAHELDASALCNVMHEARRRRRLHVRSLDACIRRHVTNHCHPVLRAARNMFAAGSAGSRSGLERRFVSMCRAHEIPLPELNVPICLDGTWYEVDCLWRDAGLCVEIDGDHSLERTRRDDLARDRAYEASRFRRLRVTGMDLDLDELRVANLVRFELGLGMVGAPL